MIDNKNKTNRTLGMRVPLSFRIFSLSSPDFNIFTIYKVNV